MFVSEDMEHLHRKLKETEDKQEELQARLRDHCLLVVKNKFSPEDIKTLEKMEQQEVALAVSYMETYASVPPPLPETS